MPCNAQPSEIVRGGIFTDIVAKHRKPGWQPAPLVELSQFAAQSNTRN